MYKINILALVFCLVVSGSVWGQESVDVESTEDSAPATTTTPTVRTGEAAVPRIEEQGAFLPVTLNRMINTIQASRVMITTPKIIGINDDNGTRVARYGGSKLITYDVTYGQKTTRIKTIKTKATQIKSQSDVRLWIVASASVLMALDPELNQTDAYIILRNAQDNGSYDGENYQVIFEFIDETDYVITVAAVEKNETETTDTTNDD